MYSFHLSGTSSSTKIASTGQAGTHAPQSMHSSGGMKSIFADSKAGSSLRGWMQSTGQTSTHAVSLVPMQGSVITYAILSSRSQSIVVRALYMRSDMMGTRQPPGGSPHVRRRMFVCLCVYAPSTVARGRAINTTRSSRDIGHCDAGLSRGASGSRPAAQRGAARFHARCAADDSSDALGQVQLQTHPPVFAAHRIGLD